VKRHQNRLRLKAMRLRPVEEPEQGLDRLLRPRTHGATPPKLIPDEMLVALEALRQAEHGILSDSLRNKSPVNPDDETAVRTTAAARALGRFCETFPDAWPPTSEQLNAFATLDKAFGPATSRPSDAPAPLEAR
jgi:hypothetical protein